MTLSLGLTIQPNTFVAHPFLLLGRRQSADGTNQLSFDLRFVRVVDEKDAGMAISGINASSTQQFGTAQMVFRNQGDHAVTSPNINIGTTGNDVNVSLLPSTVSATPTSTLTSISSTARLATSNLTRSDIKIPIIVGSIVGGLVLLATLTMLILFNIRRRHETPKRWTFHRDMMVRSRRPLPPIPQTSPSIASSASVAPHSQDLERGSYSLEHTVSSIQQSSQETELSHDPEPRLPDPIVCTTPPIASPRGYRPFMRSLQLHSSYQNPLPRAPIGVREPLTPRSSTFRSTIIAIPPAPSVARPCSPSSRTYRQQLIADQIETLRNHMLEFEREGGNDDTAMEEMCEKMAWLREHQEGPWTLGSTEVKPPAYDHYMTPS